MEVRIRPMVGADYAALRALDDAVMRYAARAFLGFDWDAAPPRQREEQRAITPESFAFYAETGYSLVAEHCGEVRGYVLAQLLHHFDLERRAVWVEDISVHPDRHRRGIATGLYRALAHRAREGGAAVILAGIHRDNQASLALHRHVGFEVYETRTAVWRLE